MTTGRVIAAIAAVMVAGFLFALVMSGVHNGKPHRSQPVERTR